MIPKFRIFDKKKKRFLDDFAMEIDRYGVHVLDGFNYVVDEDDRVIMQSTGLVDVYQEEVFKDDIIYDDHYDEYGIVKFYEGRFVIEWQENHVEDLYERIDILEVIGNIHENPELLEGDNKCM